jgi:hypothetical protein
MTEAEWLACTDPMPMLEDLRGKASERKLRLFACACCRRIWREIGHYSGRHAVVVSERYADGLADDTDLARANRRLPDFIGRFGDEVFRVVDKVSLTRSHTFGYPDPPISWLADVSYWATAVAWYARRDGEYVSVCERVAQASLLRDIFGPLPFRPVAIDPAWLAWKHGTVPAVARRVYEDRAFHDLPILADALEDAGCTAADLLAHCRSGGEHVRGCWALDLLLGRA